MGNFEARALALVELTLGYHSLKFEILTVCRNPGTGHCQMGSLTGAVASETVTEASKGSLSMVGNHAQEYKGRRELDCDTYKWSRYESRA